MIGAVILAAGQSRRMGRPKMVLPWADTTVIGQVVAVLKSCALDEIVVVTGGARDLVEAALQGMGVTFRNNPGFAENEMLESLQIGISSLKEGVEAALVTLGDQPQIQTGVVKSIIDAYETTKAPLVVPSYQMHRGHPWLVDRSLWSSILALHTPDTLRDFLNRHSSQIHYLLVDTRSVLQDLDTPEEYRRYQDPHK